ncbi:hypothetical protein Ciccas_003157 [Cichlidogyrus casuarinus]|uniref:Geminin n=1 Tax=Cichlidogyrus casuarinus TaxID=1844966 RepID=A0ABD2QIF4_9PLAT
MDTRKPLSERNTKQISRDGIKTSNTKLSKELPFEIFNDLGSHICSTCGVTKKGLSKDSGTQTLSDAIQDLVADQPSINYWRDLAEERRIALAETLDENKELCDLVQSLTHQLEKYASMSRNMQKMLHKVNAESDEENDGHL